MNATIFPGGLRSAIRVIRFLRPNCTLSDGTANTASATTGNYYSTAVGTAISSHGHYNCGHDPLLPGLGATTFKRWYSPQVKEHFNNPRNVGSFDKNDPDVGTAIVGKAACGDVIKLQIRVKDNKIEDACFKTFGCGSAIASSSYATEIIKGMSMDEALKIKNTDISEELNLPPVKIHCSLLAEDAVKHAIKDYLSKQK